MKTLRESGYPIWPYIRNCGNICFVWYSKNTRTDAIRNDLAWASFRWTRRTGKLIRSDSGYLLPVHVPSVYYRKSIDELCAEACKTPALYLLRKGKEWVGPFLYREPSNRPLIGTPGLPYLVLQREPARSAGFHLGYGVGPDFTPQLWIARRS